MNVRETPRAVARSVEWEFSQSTYAAVLADVPEALFSHWAQSAHEEYPGIPREVSFYAQAAEGLMMFFDCAAAAGKSCALPSRAADSVWHAWAQLDAAGLEGFCIRHFGRSIPHVERARMQKGEMGKALAVCLVQARRRASQPAAGGHLPRLFALDSRLGMPRGFGYRIIGGLVAFSILDEFGNPEGKVSYPGELTPYSLYLAGLVSETEYQEVVRLASTASLHAAAVASSSSGFIADLDGDKACGDGDSVCGDSDSGGDSGGGSACGGGCGGGGGCGS